MIKNFSIRNFKGFTPLDKSKRQEKHRYLTGFTLIELMIGAGILAFALCGIISGLVSFMLLAQMARDKTVAVNDAQRVMEQIWDTSFSSIASIDWTDWAVNNGCDTLDNEQVNITFAYPEALAADLLKITVTCTWQTRNRPMSVSRVTLKTRD